MAWDDGIDWNPGDPLYEDDLGGILGNIDQGGGAGSGDYSGVDIGSGSILDNIGNDTGGFDFSKLLKALGLAGGAGGSGTSLDAILPILAMLAGGYNLNNKNNANSEAAAKIQAAADKANEQATGLIGGARENYKPYMDAGVSAVGQLSGMVGKNNLAGLFGPVGATSALGDKFKGTMSLKQLSGK